MKTKTHLLALPFALFFALAATACPSPSSDEGQPAQAGGERSSEIGCRGLPNFCFDYDDASDDECRRHGCFIMDWEALPETSCHGTPTPCVRKESQGECEAHGCTWGPVAEFDGDYLGCPTRLGERGSHCRPHSRAQPRPRRPGGPRSGLDGRPIEGVVCADIARNDVPSAVGAGLKGDDP